MADLSYSVDIETRDAINGLKGLQAQIKKTDDNIARLDGTSRGVTSGLGGLKTALAAVFSGAVVAGVVNTTARFEDLRTALVSVTGSAETGAEAFKAIQALSTQTQFGVDALTESYIKLAASGIQPTERLFRVFTDAAAVTTDQMGTLQAITDLFARTTSGGLGLEELNRLADRGIPAFDILEEKIGITRLEISEYGKTAAGAAKITQALAEGIEERFGGATQDRLGNLSTLMSNFEIEVANTADTVGSNLGPALKEVIGDFTAFLNANQDLAAQLGTGLGEALRVVADGVRLLKDNMDLIFSAAASVLYIQAIRQISFLISDMRKGTSGLAVAMKGLFSIISKHPFAILGGIIVGVITYFNGFGRTVAQLSAGFEYIYDLIKSYVVRAFQSLGEAADWVAEKLGITSDATSSFADSISKLLEPVGELGIVQAMRDAGIAYDEAQAKAKSAAEAAQAAQDALNNAMPTLPGTEDALTKPIDESAIVTPEQKAADDAKKKAADEAAAAAKAYNEELKRTRDRLLPIKKAQEDFNTGVKHLNDLLARGTITREEHRTAMKNLKDEYQDFLDSQQDASTAWEDGWERAFREYKENAEDAASRAEEVFNTATRGMEDALVNFAKTGKLSFKSLLNDMAEQLLRSQIRQLMGSLGSSVSSGGGIFSSIGKMLGFANGGIIPTNNPVIVGERGPEILTGAAGNRVIPNEALGGQVVYNINAVDAPSFQALVARDPAFIHAVVQQGAKSF